MTSPAFDLAINGGLFFDGAGAPGRVVSLGVRDGKLTERRESPYSAGEARETIDATGPWVAAPPATAGRSGQNTQRAERWAGC